MKKLVKIMSLVLVAMMAMSCAACSLTSNKSLTMKIENGDTIKVELDTSDGLSMKLDKNENIINILDGDDEILSMMFADEDAVKECLDEVQNEVKVKDTGSNNGAKYSLFSYVDDDDEYYIVGWVIGSDTGIIIEGTDSKKETMNAFEAMSFEVVDTDQDDDDYYLEGVIMKDSDDRNDNEPTQETEENNKEDEKHDNVNSTEPSNTVPQETAPAETEPTEGEKDNIGGETTKVPSSNLKDCEFSIDGKVFKLPISYKELKEATGYSIKSAEEKSYLEPNYYTGVQLRDSNGDDICYIDVLNNTNEDAAYADCMVIAVGQSDYQLEDTFVIRVVGNLGVGDVTSKDALTKLFGEPSDVYEYRSEGYEEYHADTYTWSIGSGWLPDISLEIEMNINSGIIQSVDLECNAVE